MLNFFDESWLDRWSWREYLHETPEGWELTTELPGMEELSVELEGKMLVVNGKDMKGKPKTVKYFLESSLLSKLSKDKQLEASYRRGVLTVRFPRAPTELPTKVVVKMLD